MISPSKFTTYRYLGMEILNLKLGRSNFSSHLSSLKKLASLVPKSDINIATFSTTAYIAYFRSDQAMPFHHMQHMETLFTDDEKFRNLIKLAYFLPIPKVANSKWLQERVLSLTGKKYEILNPAIEHSVFYPREKLNDNKIHITALGKGGWKNTKLIYDAVNEIREKKLTDKPIVLHFFGHRVPEGINVDNHNTLFHKDISDEELAKLYSNSHIQITASVAESFPLPPLEAMACGTAVITTPYGTEDYAIDGYNALIVKPNNKSELINAILELIHNEKKRDQIAKNGIITASKFNYKDQAKKWSELLRNYFNDYKNDMENIKADFSKYGLKL